MQFVIERIQKKMFYTIVCVTSMNSKEWRIGKSYIDKSKRIRARKHLR